MKTTYTGYPVPHGDPRGSLTIKEHAALPASCGHQHTTEKKAAECAFKQYGSGYEIKSREWR